MKKAILAIAGLAIAAAAVPAQALDLRHYNQERRVDAGRRSGKLTAMEAAHLKAQLRANAAFEQRLKARHGGHLSDADKRLIKMRDDRTNAQILRLKNNRARGRNHLKI